MTDRRKERDRARRKRRKAREAAERRREQRNRRFDELMEAWRRNRSNAMRKTGRIDRGGKMFFGHNLTRYSKASESEAEGSLVDVARAALVDAELDRMICKRAPQDRRLDPDEKEELWKESVHRYNARRKEENRLAYCDYFGRLAARVRSRAEEYESRAQALLEDRGRASADGHMPRNQGEWRALQGTRYGAARVLLGPRPGQRRAALQDGLKGGQEQEA